MDNPYVICVQSHLFRHWTRWHGRLESPLVPEILWDKGRQDGDFCVLPCFAALENGRRKDSTLLFPVEWLT